MEARITTYGGETKDGYATVRHWVLSVDGRWIADTSISDTADLFQKIADKINA